MMHFRRGWMVAVCLLAMSLSRVSAQTETDQFNFAEGLFIHRDYLSAVEEFEACVRKFPQSPRVATALYRIAEAQFRLDRHERAVAAFETALTRFPDAPEAAVGSYTLARACLKLDRLESALKAFETAAAKGTGEVREEAMVGLGECLVQTGKLDAAEPHYARFLKEFPQSAHRPDILFSLGWIQAARERHEAAVASFTTMLEQFPDSRHAARARLALSDSLTALGQYERAAAILEQIEKTGALPEDVLLRRAWNRFKSGDRQGAAETFSAFATAYPESALVAPALYNAGIAYFELKDFATAVERFALILRHHADRAEAADARYWMGLALFNLNRHQEAVDALKPLHTGETPVNPATADTLAFTYAQALARLGQTDEAIRLYQALLENHAQSTHRHAAQYALALALEQAGRLADAVPVLERVLTQTPPADLRDRATFALAEYLCRLNEHRRALPHLERLAETGTDDDRLAYRLAWAYFELGQFQQAAAPFAKLAAGAGAFALEARYMTGRVAEQRDDVARAVEIYQALAQSPDPSEFQERALYRLGFLVDGAAAVANLERYAARYPKGAFRAELELKLAESLFAEGRFDDAATRYVALLEGDLAAALVVPARYGLAWCRLRQGNLAAADSLFAQVIATADIEPGIRVDAELQRGEIAHRQERWAAAVPFFERVREHPAPRGERAVYMLGWCARRLDDRATAEARFKEVLDRFPDGEFAPDSAVRLAEIYTRSDRAAEARAVLESAAAMRAAGELEEERLHLTCATLVTLQDWTVVIAAAERLLETFPESSRAHLATFRLGLAFQALGVNDKAEARFRETMAKTDTIEAAQAQFNIGTMRFAEKDYLEAAKNFLRIDMLYDYPELSAKALYHAADSFRRAGENERATIYVERLREKHPESPWLKKAEQP